MSDKPILKITHSITPKVAQELLCRLHEMRALVDRELEQALDKLEDENDSSASKTLAEIRDRLLQKKTKLLLSNLLRVAVEDLVARPYAPNELLDRVSATGTTITLAVS